MYVFTAQQLCLLRLSIGVWRRRGTAKAAGLMFNEPTVTEVFLLDLVEVFPGKVSIIPFNSKRESQIGADWAWAFIGPDGRSCQGLLVQAKRLDDHDREYSELYYQGRSSGSTSSVPQLDRLIASANRFRLPPVYAFYNHLNDPSRIPRSSCGTLGLIRSSLLESWGVAVASAINVRKAKPDKTYDCHRHHSRPLHCLLCSRGTGQQYAMGSAGAAAAALSTLFEGTSEDDGLGPDLMPPFEPATELPELFQYAEHIEQARAKGDTGLLSENRNEFPGIAGAVILRDSEDA